jgi:Ca2+-binding EF-hand superfamily protein
MSDDEIIEMIEEADKDKDGHIGKEDFIKILRQTNLF